MAEFRYFRFNHDDGSADYYRVDPDQRVGNQVRVSQDGLWVDTGYSDLADFQRNTRVFLFGLVREVPADEVPCHLCMVVAGTVTREVVHTWADALVIRPRPGPVVPGHLLVIPTRHVQDVLVDVELSTQVHFRALTYAAEHLAGGPLNVLTSRGKAATQTEPHLHYHLVPREFGDGLPLLWDRGGESRG